MLQQTAPQARPRVLVAAGDFDLLDRLANAQRSTAAELLRQELERAVVVGESDSAPPFVRLGSRVEFLDLPSGRTRAVRLVRPEQADIDAGALSVMTQVGAALLGLSTGDSFSLATEQERERVLVVIRVEDP
jgi:regulator of nucleoside diphosphate kinase